LSRPHPERYRGPAFRAPWQEILHTPPRSLEQYGMLRSAKRVDRPPSRMLLRAHDLNCTQLPGFVELRTLGAATKTSRGGGPPTPSFSESSAGLTFTDAGASAARSGCLLRATLAVRRGPDWRGAPGTSLFPSPISLSCEIHRAAGTSQSRSPRSELV